MLLIWKLIRCISVNWPVSACSRLWRFQCAKIQFDDTAVYLDSSAFNYNVTLRTVMLPFLLHLMHSSTHQLCSECGASSYFASKYTMSSSPSTRTLSLKWSVIKPGLFLAPDGMKGGEFIGDTRAPRIYWLSLFVAIFYTKKLSNVSFEYPSIFKHSRMHLKRRKLLWTDDLKAKLEHL